MTRVIEVCLDQGVKKPPPCGGGFGWGCLLFFANALERVAVGLDVHEAARVGVAFDELLRAGIERLRTLANLPVTVPISFWWICCHDAYYLSFQLGFRLEAELLDGSRRVCCSWLVKTTNSPLEDVPETETRRSGGWDKRSLAGLRFS